MSIASRALVEIRASDRNGSSNPADSRYRPVYDHNDQGSVGHLMPKQDEYNDPEMVTVPVLGAE